MNRSVIDNVIIELERSLEREKEQTPRGPFSIGVIRATQHALELLNKVCDDDAEYEAGEDL